MRLRVRSSGSFFGSPSVQHYSSTQKNNFFSAPKISQFNTPLISTPKTSQIWPPSSTPKTSQFHSPASTPKTSQFHTPISSTLKPLQFNTRLGEKLCWTDGWTWTEESFNFAQRLYQEYLIRNDPINNKWSWKIVITVHQTFANDYKKV